jgi:hypothetical protein
MLFLKVMNKEIDLSTLPNITSNMVICLPVEEMLCTCNVHQ